MSIGDKVKFYWEKGIQNHGIGKAANVRSLFFKGNNLRPGMPNPDDGPLQLPSIPAPAMRAPRSPILNRVVFPGEQYRHRLRLPSLSGNQSRPQKLPSSLDSRLGSTSTIPLFTSGAKDEDVKKYLKDKLDKYLEWEYSERLRSLEFDWRNYGVPFNPGDEKHLYPINIEVIGDMLNRQIEDLVDNSAITRDQAGQLTDWINEQLDQIPVISIP